MMGWMPVPASQSTPLAPKISGRGRELETRNTEHADGPKTMMGFIPTNDPVVNAKRQFTTANVIVDVNAQ